VALVTGIFGAVLVSVPLGIIALRQIGRTKESGRGLAIAGLVLSGVWTVALGALAVILVLPVIETGHGSATLVATSSPSPAATGKPVDVDNLRVGECTAKDSDADFVSTVQVLPCKQPHYGEVYAVVTVPGERLPSDRALDEICRRRLRHGFPAQWADNNVDYTWIGPDQSNWDDQDRGLVCYTITEEPRTGSFLR
jgi:hypothetical protein